LVHDGGALVGRELCRRFATDRRLQRPVLDVDGVQHGESVDRIASP